MANSIGEGNFHLTFKNGRLTAKQYWGMPINGTKKYYKGHYWEFLENGTLKYHSTWGTDLKITKDTMFDIVKGGRACWKIENETFNTLKNQGYEFEHNFGHGHNNLSTIFSMLMLLAFLIDQIQLICCGLFHSAKNRYHAKIVLWEELRNTFKFFKFDSWKMLYGALANGVYTMLVAAANTS